MENDLDCFESPQDHIHVRNAGIIDELGHVTSNRPLPLSGRHVLSDKTGTITENNLRVVALATPTKEYSLKGAVNDSDAALSLLLLNMITNHSALSIRNTASSDLADFACSISHAQSKTLLESPRLSSFSEIIIASNAEESPREWIPPVSEDNVQVFCSSQDERVSPLRPCERRPSWTRLRSSATSSASGDRTSGNWTSPFTASPTRSTSSSGSPSRRSGSERPWWSAFVASSTSSARYARTCRPPQGADSVVIPLLTPEEREGSSVGAFIDRSSRQAYRTLVFAGKRLSEAEYATWEQTLLGSGYSASSVPESLQRQLEADQHLEGAIAIQDDLAADVFISIRKLQAAGIRFWILTGDKADTAEAIAFAAGVVHPAQRLVRLTAKSLPSGVSLARALREVLGALPAGSPYSVLVDEFVMDCVFGEEGSAYGALNSSSFQPDRMSDRASGVAVGSSNVIIESSIENADMSIETANVTTDITNVIVDSSTTPTATTYAPFVTPHTPIDNTNIPTATPHTPLKTLFLHCLCRAQSVIIARMRKDQKQQITLQLKEFGKQVHLAPLSPIEQPAHPRAVRGRRGERHRNDPRERHRRRHQGQGGTPGLQQLRRGPPLLPLHEQAPLRARQVQRDTAADPGPLLPVQKHPPLHDHPPPLLPDRLLRTEGDALLGNRLLQHLVRPRWTPDVASPRCPF